MPRKPGGTLKVHLSDEARRALLNRISRIEGQVGALKRCIARGECGDDLLVQIAAVRGAMAKVAAKILEDHLIECANSCMKSKGGQGDVRARIVTALGSVLKQA